MSETRHTFCRICEVLCGLEATVYHVVSCVCSPELLELETVGW